MRRVARFRDMEKPAHTLLNEWLAENPDAVLIDIKPLFSKSLATTVYAIVEIPDKTEGEETE